MRTQALVPGAPPRDLWQELREHRDESAVLLTGHDPQFSSMVPFLLGSTHHMVHFRKGALIRMDADSMGAEPHCVLEWMITPGIARAR